LSSDFGDALGNLVTTSRAMNKWMLQLDSTGQKGPEITLEGVLIVVESGFMIGKQLVRISLSLYISCKLLWEIPEQLCIYCKNLLGMCQKVGMQVYQCIIMLYNTRKGRDKAMKELKAWGFLNLCIILA